MLQNTTGIRFALQLQPRWVFKTVMRNISCMIPCLQFFQRGGALEVARLQDQATESEIPVSLWRGERQQRQGVKLLPVCLRKRSDPPVDFITLIHSVFNRRKQLAEQRRGCHSDSNQLGETYHIPGMLLRHSQNLQRREDDEDIGREGGEVITPKTPVSHHHTKKGQYTASGVWKRIALMFRPAQAGCVNYQLYTRIIWPNRCSTYKSR